MKRLLDATVFRLRNLTPLTCIANLSSDEVFTPPQLANRILDLLPAKLWSDRRATFLDPGCKSGVFLREIAKRLDKGLCTQSAANQAPSKFPDKQGKNRECSGFQPHCAPNQTQMYQQFQ